MRAISRISSDGSIRSFPLSIPVVQLGRLAVAPDGAVWFADITTASVTRLQDGVFMRHEVGSPGATPYGIAVDTGGTVWATIQGADKLARISTDGQVTALDVPTHSSGLGDIVVDQHQRVTQHRPQRRNAGAAGDEHKPLLRRLVGKLERADRTFDVDRRAGLESEMRSRLAVAFNAHQELEHARAGGIRRRRGNRVRSPLRVLVAGDQDSLARAVIEPRAAEGEPYDPRARRCRKHLPDRQSHEHDRFMLTHAHSPRSRADSALRAAACPGGCGRVGSRRDRRVDRMGNARRRLVGGRRRARRRRDGRRDFVDRPHRRAAGLGRTVAALGSRLSALGLRLSVCSQLCRSPRQKVIGP